MYFINQRYLVDQREDLLRPEIPAIVARLSTPGVIKGLKRAKVDNLLNTQPNPFQDVNTFKRNLITDYLLDGNIFIY